MLTVSAARSLARREPLRHRESLFCNCKKVSCARATRAGTGFLRMAAVFAQHIDGECRNAGHRLFVLLQLTGREAAAGAFVVPRGMAVVAEHQLGADARDFAGGLRGLHVAQVAEELHGPRQAFGDDGSSAPPRASSSSTSRIWQREASSQHRASAMGKVTPWRWP